MSYSDIYYLESGLNTEADKYERLNDKEKTYMGIWTSDIKETITNAHDINDVDYSYNTEIRTSIKSMLHYSQLINFEYLAYFDYLNNFKNIAAYGTWYAPKINVNNIKDMNIMQVVGSRDPLGSPKDNNWFYK